MLPQNHAKVKVAGATQYNLTVDFLHFHRLIKAAVKTPQINHLVALSSV